MQLRDSSQGKQQDHDIRNGIWHRAGNIKGRFADTGALNAFIPYQLDWSALACQRDDDCHAPAYRKAANSACYSPKVSKASKNSTVEHEYRGLDEWNGECPKHLRSVISLLFLDARRSVNGILMFSKTIMNGCYGNP